MRFYVLVAVAIGIQAYAPPKVILEGENGITVDDDGSTNIDGETGITTNAQGQTTNVGGSGGISITSSANTRAKGNKNTTAVGESGNRTTSATKPKGTGSGVSDLTALLNALSGEGGAAPKINGTATTVTPQAQPEAVIGEGAKGEGAKAE